MTTQRPTHHTASKQTHCCAKSAASLAARPYRERPWDERKQTLGNSAEGAFLAVLPLGPAEALGLRATELQTYRLPPFVLATPDFWTEGGALVEVMGLGVDDTLKVKTAKLEALNEWNVKASVLWVFVFHSTRQQWLLIAFHEFWDLCQRVASEIDELPTFYEGKPYVPVAWAKVVKISTERGET